MAAQTVPAATPESKPAASPKSAPPQPAATAARMRGGQRGRWPAPALALQSPRARGLWLGLARRSRAGLAQRLPLAAAQNLSQTVPDHIPRPETPLGAALTAAGEAAVGARVAVWWPEDKVFYKVRADSLSWLCWGTFPAKKP